MNNRIKEKIYKYIITINGQLFKWNSQAILVDKMENPKLKKNSNIYLYII